jgi:hypothetical protein
MRRPGPKPRHRCVEEDVMELMLVDHADGRLISLGEVRSKEEATRQVAALEERYSDWEQRGFPELPPSDLLLHYEGCDFYLETAEGRFVLENDDDWVKVSLED